MNLVIETEDLSRRYGDVIAVDHLSLRVAEGEVYAFLGLNGSGKTTTIRMLLGMIRPSGGSARVLGARVRLGRQEPWAAVGYLVETPHGYPELTVRENLEVARRLHPGTPHQDVDHFLERLGLAAYADRRAGTLSLGNAERLGLAKALLHRPRLLLLDEPANGLDPAGIVEIRTLLLDLTREQGVTVFMASHILAEVARLAQRIGIIHQGRLLQELDVAELERNRRRRLLVRSRDAAAAHRVLAAAGHCSRSLPDGTIELTDEAAVAHPEDIAGLLVQSGTPPTHLQVDEEDLEQYFLRLVGSQSDADMNDLANMIWIEQRKAWRSAMPLFTLAGSLFMPLGMAFLIFVARNPDISRQLGLVSAKANLMAYAATDWRTYLGLTAQMIAAGGFLVLCLIIGWVFGREFADGTLKDLLAVPVRRSSILLAKFIVAGVWFAGLALAMLLAAILTGVLMGLPEGSPASLLGGATLAAATAGLVILVAIPLAFFASVGRGYLLPVGVAILVLIMANLVALAGWGEYFPWALPGLYAQDKGYLAPASYLIAILTGLVGMLATDLWWMYADQSR